MAQLGISSEDEEGEVESVYTAGVGEGVPGVHREDGLLRAVRAALFPRGKSAGIALPRELTGEPTCTLNFGG